MQLFNLIVILFINFQIFSSILIETGKKDKYCFYKHIDGGDTLQLSYVITGENEEKVNCVLTRDNTVVFHHEASDNGDHKEEVKQGGLYKVCFLPLNANPYYVSFEFFTNFEKGH